MKSSYKIQLAFILALAIFIIPFASSTISRDVSGNLLFVSKVSCTSQLANEGLPNNPTLPVTWHVFGEDYRCISKITSRSDGGCEFRFTYGACSATNVGCISSCVGRVCGDNGCGGSCGGTCAAGYHCTLWQCIKDGDTSCIPNCAGKNCGLTGCGKTCGTCNASYECSSLYEGVCVPKGMGNPDEPLPVENVPGNTIILTNNPSIGAIDYYTKGQEGAVAPNIFNQELFKLGTFSVTMWMAAAGGLVLLLLLKK